MSFKKYLKEVEQLDEALPLKQAMKYRRVWNPNQYQDMFMSFPATMRDKKGFRLYLPYTEPERPITVPYDIRQTLAKDGYTIADYVAGLAYKTGGDMKRKIKIGKLLTEYPILLKKFTNDPQRTLGKSLGKLVCISRHPYDIAGMSTDRGWRSCMELNDGINRRYVLNDVKEGTIIAYLIHEDDKNINKPISRLLIKPFISVNDPDDIMLVTDAKQYGTHDKEFGDIVEEWLEKVNGPDKKGMYKINRSLYNDGKAVKVAGMADLSSASVEQQKEFIEEYLDSVGAATSMLRIDDGEYIIETWRDLNQFCSSEGDDTLEYLLDLYENQSELKDKLSDGLDRDVVEQTLRLLPEALLRDLCKRFSVKFVPDNDTGFSTMITDLSYKDEIGHEIQESMVSGDDLEAMLKDRITKYIENGWRFVIDSVYLHVPKSGDEYDLTAVVELRISQRSMLSLVENHMEDPDGEDGGNGDDELWRITNGKNDSWSSMDRDYSMSEWRGQYVDEPLVDSNRDDLVFGSKRRPKIDVDGDGVEVGKLADSYEEFLRGEKSTHIKSDDQPDLFDSHMRKLINAIKLF